MSGRGLPDASWRHSPGLKAVVAALTVDGQSPRLVGGAVRDGLLGLPVSDIDLATPLLPAEVTKRLDGHHIKAVPTGIEHGTITAVSHGQPIEVTTLRRDVSTDGRRATVAYSTDWREDAARRDFTINALYADPASGEIYDYHGGLTDLAVPSVRFIGDPAARIAEDHLRILRLFRFHARFGKGPIDAEALAAATAAAPSLMALSRERIADELTKLLSLPDPGASIAAMISQGIFAAFLPEIAADAVSRLQRLMGREVEANIPPKWERRLNALLPDDRPLVDGVVARLKLSNRARTNMAFRLSNLKPQSCDARSLAYRSGFEIARDIIALHAPDDVWRDALGQIQGWDIPAFPVKGGDLVARGLTAGPVVARTLSAIEQQWVAEGFPAADRAAVIADQAVADALLASRKE